MMSSTVSLAVDDVAAFDAAATVAVFPRVQTAAKGAAGKAAQDPKMQMAGRSLVASAASKGVAQATSGLVEVRRYVQESHISVRILSFSVALALLAFSILGVINVFNAAIYPYQYLSCFYNVVFAVVIIIADGKPEWFTRLWDVQTKLFSKAAFLASQSGRAVFYLYVGSINLCMLPDSWLWKVMYLGIGATLCFNGALMLLSSLSCGKCAWQHERMPEDSMETGVGL